MSAPTTPMEDGGTWATVAEGEAFLDDLAASGRVTYATIGTASDGNLIRAVTVSADGLARLSGTHLLIVATQHGYEEVPREAALRVMRDMAFGTAPSVPVTFIPTPNPYGVTHNTRHNANNVDINRTHVDLSSPEGLAINQAIRTAKPQFVVDAHQWGNAAALDINIRTHGEVAAHAYRQWSEEFFASVVAEFPDRTVREYPPTEHEGSLSNTLPAQGVPTVLLETDYSQPDEDEIAWQMHFMAWAVDYTAANGLVLDVVKGESQAWLASEGYAAHAPLPMYESGWLEPPVGYILDAGDIDPTILAAHGIRTHQRRNYDASLYVPMDQPAAAIIAWLIDPRAPRPLAHAEPVWPDSDAAIDPTVAPLQFPRDIKTPAGRARRLIGSEGIAWGS